MHDLIDDPETVAALFESAVPELSPPVAILREPDGARGVARFTVRTRGAAYRMKVGVDAAASDAVRRGALALSTLAAHGLSVARSLAVHGAPEVGRGVIAVERPTVAVETRLGTTDAGIAWPVLGDVGRRGLLVAAVDGLRSLHSLPADVVPDGSVGAWRERVRRCADRNLARLAARDGLSSTLLAEVRARIRRGLEALPAEVALAPCHGSPGLREIAVERRAFAGWRDFETLRLADPWLDLAHLTFAVEGPESTPQACSIIAAYRAGGAGPDVPADVADRLAFYVSLLAVAGVAGLDADEDLAASLALETVLAWDCREALARAV
jgi:hypothetical protein